MNSSYIRALEKQAEWLRWAQDEGGERWAEMGRIARNDPEFWKTALPLYTKTLHSKDTFFMNKKFCELVEFARTTVPDEIKFDPSWFQTKSGWLWLETPFSVPTDLVDENGNEMTKPAQDVKISAIGWFSLKEGSIIKRTPFELQDQNDQKLQQEIVRTGAVQVCMFQDFNEYNPGVEGFGCWSYLILRDGDELGSRIKQFENVAARLAGVSEKYISSGIEKQTVVGSYKQSRENDLKHELRWLYCALHLMSQRLALDVTINTDRNTRRRNAALKRPVSDVIRVITLRRMEEDRKKANTGDHEPVDWQWQWTVKGHWRNQYYPSTMEHKPVFVEAYLKGPEDKPLKPDQSRLFIAGR